jgi:hypothetical protein
LPVSIPPDGRNASEKGLLDIVAMSWEEVEAQAAVDCASAGGWEAV